ncbi:MAG: UDP-glucose/GDP-mannose dehydrogenase family protein [bacterium]
MQKVCIVGTGYVGLVTGVCLAEIGHNVICIDNNQDKVSSLKKGIVPIYEAGLEKLVKKNSAKKRLFFSSSIKEGVDQSNIIFIAVNTPPLPDGSADLSFVEAVACEIAHTMKSYKVIVEKSTVPIETCHRVKETIARNIRKKLTFDVVSNPEFLREGTAVRDFLKPDRIVIGSDTFKASRIMQNLYKPIKAPHVLCDVKTAELIKHASNSFLAMKISFINSVSRICDLTGADITKVAEGMGLDKRINPAFLKAGIGYGGSCFPKDVAAFAWIARNKGFDFKLLDEVRKINNGQIDEILKKITNVLWNIQGKLVTILGLSFKPETDDLRNAPSLEIIKHLLSAKARIKVHDPICMEKVKSLFPGLEFCADPYKALADSCCLILVTEWDEYKKLNFRKVKKLMKGRNIVDGRNMFNPQKIKNMGFIYRGVGIS